MYHDPRLEKMQTYLRKPEAERDPPPARFDADDALWIVAIACACVVIASTFLLFLI